MRRQTNLFGSPRGTSADASPAPDQAAAVRRRLLDFLRERGSAGATDEELQDALRVDGNTERPRRGELEAAGLVRSAGRTRPTRKGKAAVVWIATAAPVQFVPAVEPLPVATRPELATDWPTDLVAWALGLSAADLPEAFTLAAGVVVTDRDQFLRALRRDLQVGPCGPRARLGVLADDLRRLRRCLAGD